MGHCFFVSDLHGRKGRHESLLRAIAEEGPRAVFIGGDSLPCLALTAEGGDHAYRDFVRTYLVERLRDLRDRMKEAYPEIFIIMGNDDARILEPVLVEAQGREVWHYAHSRRIPFDRYHVYGYSFVPPTPFMLKDWERYDVSQYVDPGCVAPEDGSHTIDVESRDIRYSTIKDDLQRLTADHELRDAIFLFHAPPYQTKLDRAALDGKMVDNVPMDVHVGSIAIRRFIEARQPLLTLHGHVHESSRLTGSWRDRIGRTHAFSAAYDGPELALVRFDPEDLDSATRQLI